MKTKIILLSFFLFLTTEQVALGQTYAELEKNLKKEFPENSTEDGRFVFYSDKADITKIEKPLVKAVIPSYEFCKVTFTNFLGYHINEVTCVVLFDNSKANIILVPPLWYTGIDETLIKLFLKKPFENKEKLISFLNEFNELMEIGSGYKFVYKNYSDSLITYDLVAFKGDSYTTSGNGITSKINYTSDQVWRQIEIKLKDFKITEYVSINPAIKDKKEYRNQYRETIK